MALNRIDPQMPKRSSSAPAKYVGNQSSEASSISAENLDPNIQSDSKVSHGGSEEKNEIRIKERITKNLEKIKNWNETSFVQNREFSKKDSGLLSGILHKMESDLIRQTKKDLTEFHSILNESDQIELKNLFIEVNQKLNLETLMKGEFENDSEIALFLKHLNTYVEKK
ncbi:hypothetical protein DID75_03725 [Candidatus Marinamargulisbacteria bacterium SCGC AG-410-N11]|nr:hypothetical protein DID75_03725 [Candidatus Marinamargulisbacteria bacterium SCGC AG-410-N11]